MKYRDENYSLNPKTGRGEGWEATEGRCARGKLWRSLSGRVSTLHGYVIARSHFYEAGHKGSTLSVIKDGREYHRFFDEDLSPRALVIRAKRFVAELFKVVSDENN